MGMVVVGERSKFDGERGVHVMERGRELGKWWNIRRKGEGERVLERKRKVGNVGEKGG